MAVQGVALGVVAVGVEVAAHQFLALVTLVGCHAAGEEGVGVFLGLGAAVTLETAVADEGLGPGAFEAGGSAVQVLGFPEGRIGLQGHPLGFHGGAQEGGDARCGAQEQGPHNALRLGYRPLDGIEAAVGGADEQVNLFDSQMFAHGDEGAHAVPDGDAGEIQHPGLAGGGIDARRALGAVSAAQHIHAHHKVLFRVYGTACSHHLRPPVLRVAVGGKRVADPHHASTPLLRGMEHQVGSLEHTAGFQRKVYDDFLSKHFPGPVLSR